MNNITFDLETLGNTSEAPIVQIAAVKFNEDGIYDEFDRKIKLESLDKYNFKVDYSTLLFWFSQKDIAIKQVMVEGDRIDLRQALREFIEWIGKPSEYNYWSHATFDPPILKNNLDKVQVPNSIPFRNHRDIRTLTHFTGKIETEFKGVKHNALDDCRYQAEYILTGFDILGH